jgi:peptidoglycan/LPS O-acetylase OafA/YrhL
VPNDLIGLSENAAPITAHLRKERFFYTLDGIRGVAAFLVVLWHTGILFGLDHHHKNYMAVDIFFVLSGVVICKTYEERMKFGLSAARFTAIRIIRIYPLYIVGTAISLIAILAGFGPPEFHAHIAALALLALFFVPNPSIGKPAQMFPLNFPAWSLFFELATNIVYAFTLKYLSNRVLVGLIAGLGAGLAFFVFDLPEHRVDIGFTVSSIIAGICRSGYSFFTGVLLYRLFSAAKTLPARWRGSQYVPWVILGCVTAILLAGTSKTINPFYDLMSVLLVFPGLIFLALHFEPGAVSARFFRFAGGLSYAVYAVHDSLFHALEGITARQHYDLRATAPYSGFVFLAVLFSLCALLDKLYDAPIRQFLTRRLPKTSTASIAIS